MKLSIIIPYTTGRYLLEDCLDSLREQQVDNFEVILIQDQIPAQLNQEGNINWIENPNAIIEKYQVFFPIQYIQNEQQKGVAACRNLGITLAQGEYIYFMDMDDYLMPGTLAQMLQQADCSSSELIYGDKKTTWYKKKVFFEILREKEEQKELKRQAQQMEQVSSGQDSSQQAIEEASVGDEEHLSEEESIEEYGRKLKYDTSSLGFERSEFIQKMIVRRRGMLGISALHMMMKRSFLEEYGLRFLEDLPLYSDVVFVAQVAIKVQTVSYVPDAYYVKRKRNNPVQYPSLSQMKSESKFDWYITVYRRVKEELKQYPTLSRVFDQKIINFYCGTFATRLRRSENDCWRGERFQVMQEIAKQLPPEMIKCQKSYKKRLLHALRKGNLGLSIFYVNLHLGRIKAKRVLHNRKLISTYLYFHYFTKMSLKQNYIMCESFLGRNYADSPKNIFEYMSKQYPGNYKFIWSVDKKTEFPYPCTVVKRFGIRYAYYLARSKYFVFNMRQPMWMRKREGQVFLQTWHGTPLKKLVYDQEEVLSATPLYKQQVYKQSRQWDYLVSVNRFSTEVFKSAFLYDKEILEYGYPRNDLMYSKNRKEEAEQIKKKLNLPMDKKVILYAPTWRDDEYYEKGKYKFALHMDIEKYRQALGDEYILLLRTHYFIADQLNLSEFAGFAFNVSKYDDITELYIISDICITDYSSVFFDFANLKRPVLFYTYDLEKYRDILRGFYLDIEKDVPGPLLFTDEEVIHAIKNIEQVNKQYAQRYEAFYQRFCSLDDGRATERIVNCVFGE